MMPHTGGNLVGWSEDEKHSNKTENFSKSFLRLFSAQRVYTCEEVTLVVVWVGGGFMEVEPPLFKSQTISLLARGITEIYRTPAL